MPLLDPKTWQARPLSGPEYTVTEPATGDTLATVTLASAEDVAGAAETARPAQAEVPRLPPRVRAGDLRMGGEV